MRIGRKAYDLGVPIILERKQEMGEHEVKWVRASILDYPNVKEVSYVSTEDV